MKKVEELIQFEAIAFVRGPKTYKGPNPLLENLSEFLEFYACIILLDSAPLDLTRQDAQLKDALEACA